MSATLLRRPLFLSLTTTEPGCAGEIVRISARRADAKSFEQLVRGPRLTLAQARLANVTNTQLDRAPDIDEALQALLEFAHGCDRWIVPRGNAARERLREAAENCGIPGLPGPGVIGIDELASVIFPTVPNWELSTLQKHFSKEPIDTELELIESLWNSLSEALLKLPLPLLAEMNWMLAKSEHPLRGMLKTAEGRAVENQFTDTFNSGKISLESLFKDFSEIIDRLSDGDGGRGVPAPTKIVEQPICGGRDALTTMPLSASIARQLLGPSGPLAKNLDGYEERPEQMEMAERVAQAFAEGKHLLVEAGTGVGKSLAYLVPAILHAQQSARPVMVSTYTKNLQSQLFHKDIPFLKKSLGVEFEAALLKGRPNYLCARKFMYTLQESSHELDDEDRARMLPVMTWATQTETGDVSELAAYSPEQNYELWDRLHTVGDDCLKRQCPFYKRCFVYKARGLARSADVVVLNHAVVFSDLNLESGTLPQYHEIVFDEAHKLEDAATEHLSAEITGRRIYKILNRLYRTSGGGAGKGLLPALLHGLEMSRGEFTEPLFDSIRSHILAAMQNVQPANDGSETLISTLRDWTEAATQPPDDSPAAPYVPGERGRRDSSDSDFAQPQPAPRFQKKRSNTDDRKRFSSKTLRPDEVEQFNGGKESAIAGLGRLRQSLDTLAEDFKEIRKRDVPRSRELIKEIEAQNGFLAELISDIEFIIKADEPNYVYWSERLGKRGARIVAAPLDISALLHSQLYEKKRSIIFTSATLSVRDADADEASGFAPMKVVGASLPRQIVKADDFVGAETPPPPSKTPHPKSFEFLKTRFGMSLCNPDTLDELLLGSPFDYDSQCRLFIPTFLPEPGGPREKEYTAALASMAAENIALTGGKAMILYTSYSALNASAFALRKMLAPAGIEVLAQGIDGSREALLARLKENRSSVLLGTASFWEGIDVRGDALSLLIIAKLPFAVFTDPIVEGRCEILEASGKDAFLHFSVPNAILKLRQGFGRLIRSKIDRGIVILADKRVLTKRYGAAFLRALPARAVAQNSADGLARAVKGFFDGDE